MVQLSVARRGGVGVLLENAAEMKTIGKAHLSGDVVNRFIAFTQQPAGFTDADLLHIADGSRVQPASKGAAESVGTHRHHTGKIRGGPRKSRRLIDGRHGRGNIFRQGLLPADLRLTKDVHHECQAQFENTLSFVRFSATKQRRELSHKSRNGLVYRDNNRHLLRWFDVACAGKGKPQFRNSRVAHAIEPLVVGNYRDSIRSQRHLMIAEVYMMAGFEIEVDSPERSVDIRKVPVAQFC